MDDIHYREYKILLRPERFFNPTQFEVYWKKLCAVADLHKVGVVTNKDAFHRHVREVLFYDTETCDLYRNGFILRKRTFYTDGWPDPEHELTLKFRHADLKTAAEIDVTPYIEANAAIKFKEEVLPLKDEIGGVRSLYSHNCVLMTPALEMNQGLEHIAGVFPCIARLAGPSGNTKVSLVNNLPVQEVLVSAGSFDFGHGVAAKATIAIWRNRTTETSLIGEFAFQVKFDNYDALHLKSKARSEDFFKDVQIHAPDWVALGATKTAVVYSLGHKEACGRE